MKDKYRTIDRQKNQLNRLNKGTVTVIYKVDKDRLPYKL
jgi:hypothetical protein